MNVKTAIILAAGRGSRLGHLTDTQPKCLTKLAGKALLEWQIEALRGAGIEHIVIVGGYFRDMLSSYCDELLINENWAKTNMVATLACAEKYLRHQPCIVSYADIVYPAKWISRLCQMEGDIAMLYDEKWQDLWQVRFEDPLSDAETFTSQNGKLVEIGNRAKTLGEIEGQFMGLFRFTPSGWDIVQHHLATLPKDKRAPLDVTSLLSGLLDKGQEIYVSPVQGAWCEVDNQTDLNCYEACIEQAKNTSSVWLHDWRNT